MPLWSLEPKPLDRMSYTRIFQVITCYIKNDFHDMHANHNVETLIVILSFPSPSQRQLEVRYVMVSSSASRVPWTRIATPSQILALQLVTFDKIVSVFFSPCDDSKHWHGKQIEIMHGLLFCLPWAAA